LAGDSLAVFDISSTVAGTSLALSPSRSLSLSLPVSLHSSLKSLALGLKLIVINGLPGFEDKGPGPGQSKRGAGGGGWPDDSVWERSPMGQWAGRQRALQALPCSHLQSRTLRRRGQPPPGPGPCPLHLLALLRCPPCLPCAGPQCLHACGAVVIVSRPPHPRLPRLHRLRCHRAKLA
jgi:hypothetical protein